MTPITIERDWILEEPSRRTRVGTAWLALGISLAIHWLLIRELPPIPLAPQGWHVQSRRVPVRVENVRATPPEGLAEPRAAERAPGARPVTEAVPEPPARAVDPARIVGVRPPMPSDEPVRTIEPSARSEWQPRPHRMEISREVIREQIAALPRRVEPLVPRLTTAPDFVPPSVPEPVRPAHAQGLAVGAGQLVEAGAVTEPLPPLPPPVATAMVRPERASESPEPAGPTAVPGMELGRVTRERPERVQPASPIEHLLHLELHVWLPPDEPDWKYFSVQIHRASETVLPVLPVDIMFIQDCSASMGAAKVAACRQGLHRALRVLDEQDRLELMMFRDVMSRCFGEWTPANPTTQARAGWFIEQMESKGMTDVYGALTALASTPLDENRPTLAVFLSDGRPTVGLQDNFEIIQRFTDSNQGRVSVFSVGVGRGVNRFLLDFLSFKNRGDARTFTDLGQAPSAIEAFVRELSRPVLIELSHRWSGVDDRDIYPKMLTHLYLDRPLTLHGRVPRSADRVGVRILGRSGRQQHDMVYGLNLSQGQVGGPDLRELWIRQRLTWLVGEHIRTRDPALRNEAWEWARRLGPSAPYAAELGFPQAPVRAD